MTNVSHPCAIIYIVKKLSRKDKLWIDARERRVYDVCSRGFALTSRLGRDKILKILRIS